MGPHPWTSSSDERLPLLVSGFSDRGRGGGLFVLDGRDLSVIDHIGTTGVSVSTDGVARLLWASSAWDSVAELIVYDERGVVSYRRLDEITDPHDVLHCADGAAIVVSSEQNRVVHVAADGACRTLWQGSEVSDSWHPNCVVEVDGEVWCTAFGEFESTRAWADAAGSGAGFLRNLSTGETIAGLDQPHSPRLVDGWWWVCNSHPRTLVRCPAGGGRWEVVAELSGYPRGLAVIGDVAYVGESAGRDGSTGGSGSIAVVRDGSVVERVPLPCEEVYDVVPISPSLVGGLRRGFDTNLQRVADREGTPTLWKAGSETTASPSIGQLLDPANIKTEVELDVPVQMAPGESERYEVTIGNRCAQPLATVPPHPVRLGSRWFDEVGSCIDGERVPLGGILDVRDSLVVGLGIAAPERPGRYRLLVSLIEDGVGWFDELEPENGWTCIVHVGEEVSSDEHTPAEGAHQLGEPPAVRDGQGEAPEAGSRRRFLSGRRSTSPGGGGR